MNLWPYRIFPQDSLCPACSYHMLKDGEKLFCYNAMCKSFDKQLNDKFLRKEKSA